MSNQQIEPATGAVPIVWTAPSHPATSSLPNHPANTLPNTMGHEMNSQNTDLEILAQVWFNAKINAGNPADYLMIAVRQQVLAGNGLNSLQYDELCLMATRGE
jgi:hypothetical protein